MLDKNKKAPTRVREEGSDEPAFALGRQLTLEYYDCGPEVLLEKSTVENALLEAARESGATIISTSFHQFAPQGVSGVVIIAESHFTVHAWPEHNYAAVDIFTCGDNIDLDRAIHAMQAGFSAGRVVVSSDMNRGLISGRVNGKEHNGGGFMSPGQALSPDGHTLPISWRKTWERCQPGSVSLLLDLYGCDPEVIRNPDELRGVAVQLCENIGKPHVGDIQALEFDGGGGANEITVALALSNATISGRFDSGNNTAYLDITSDVYYEPRDIAEFALGCFRAGHYKLQIVLRQ